MTEEERLREIDKLVKEQQKDDRSRYVSRDRRELTLSLEHMAYLEEEGKLRKKPNYTNDTYKD